MTGLVAGKRRDRRRAIRDLAPTAELPYALRRVLYTDRDAEIRAAAARRLATLDHGAIETWLLDALGDASPLVRDAILRSLARRGGHRSITAIRAIVRGDRVWWVRRTAIYALAAVAAEAELSAFKTALADPFWRVRHAAVKVLAVLGARDIGVRGEIVAAPPSSTLAYLRSSWGPAAIEAPARAGRTRARRADRRRARS
jgi:hypothetical protein